MRFFCVCSFLLVANQPLVAQTNFSIEPFGYVKLTITAGSGISRKVSLLSIPLQGAAQIKGSITGKISFFGANSLSSEAAGWEIGELSNPAKPHAILITSGQEEGRMFLISNSIPNTLDTIYIDDSEFLRQGSLRGLSILQNDTFKIISVDTLSSFFGNPDNSLILGGINPNFADTLTIITNGSATSYYFNTNLNRWSRVALGNPDASHVPLLPYYGIQYSRLGPTPLEFLVMGQVPMGKRVVPIKESGSTLLSQSWAGDRTLSSMGLNNVVGWRNGANASSSDILTATLGGSVSSFFYDGANWRRVALGNPIANNLLFPIGSSLLINRKGNLGGFFPFSEIAPY